MNVRLTTALENHPSLGWLVVLMNWLIAAFSWLFQHADDIGKLLAAGAALFGFMAGFYTWRIQRRTWLRGDKPKPSWWRNQRATETRPHR